MNAHRTHEFTINCPDNSIAVYRVSSGNNELETFAGKGQDRGAAFLGRDAGAPHTVLTLVVCCGMTIEFFAVGRSRQRELACRASVSLPKNAAPRSRPLPTAVLNLLYDVITE
ncbi:hypothetical protein Y032_0222g2602 [Ancylostoma ceylanicum]|uniref:Uncharacterized protein n=1 Tax=Ancylostoma ceylanicum TaxID=53326 RepID=A0A016SIH6_9BILA|nr:hypothetical protein Y032_0222g2602 [Ancylostoma ceylanicum]